MGLLCLLETGAQASELLWSLASLGELVIRVIMRLSVGGLFVRLFVLRQGSHAGQSGFKLTPCSQGWFRTPGPPASTFHVLGFL